MPDRLITLVRPGGTVQITVPRLTIELQIVESRRNGAVIRDFTGVNAIPFWPTLRDECASSPEARDEFEQLILGWLIERRAAR